MAFPVYIHQLTVTDTAVTPQGPLSCGVAGDECAARLRVRFDAADAADYDYRLEVVAGDGTYDLTDWLPLTDGEVLFDIPSRWTAAGIAAVRLVRYVCAEDGIQTARQYYPPVLLQFAYRDEGVQPTDAPLQWQELITRAEAVLDEASEAARLAGEATSVAQQSLEQLQQSTEEAIKTIQDASDQAEGIAVDCADMRDSAQKFADDAANSARLAEEAVDGVKKNCVKPIDWRYKHGSFVISYPDIEEGRPAVAETDYYLSSQNGSDVSDDYIVPTVTEVKGIVSDELRDVETEIDGVKADSVKPSDWSNRFGHFVVSWPNMSEDGRPTVKETDYTLSNINPSAGDNYTVPTVSEVNVLITDGLISSSNVDYSYNPKSNKPQTGIAVAEAVAEVKTIVDAKIDKPQATPQVGNTLKVASVNEDGTFTCEWANSQSVGAGYEAGNSTEGSTEWDWRKWDDGKIEGWGFVYYRQCTTTKNGSFVTVNFTLPSGMDGVQKLFVQYRSGAINEVTCCSASVNGLECTAILFYPKGEPEMVAFDLNVYACS